MLHPQARIVLMFFLKTCLFIMLFKRLLFLNEGEAEPEISGFAIGGVVLRPERDPAEAGASSTSACPKRTSTVIVSRKLRYQFTAVGFPVIQTPFRHVATHVIQAKLVRFLLSHWL